MVSLTRLGCAAIPIACALAGCNLDNQGEPPEEDELYFPNALAVAPSEGKPRYLFVANSNFDLRWSEGNVQALSLEKLEDKLADCDRNEPCELEVSELLEDEILISSFATSLAPSSDGRFLFVTTRTADSLTYIDLDASAEGDDVLDCGASRRCDQYADLGVVTGSDGDEPGEWAPDPSVAITGPLSQWIDETQREETLRAWLEDDDSWRRQSENGTDVEPVPQYVAVAHRTGQVSLFVERPEGGFQLTAQQQITGGDVTGIGYDPSSRHIYLTRAGGSETRRLYRVGIVISPRVLGSFPFEAGPLALQGVSSVPDTRAITFIPGFPEGSASLREDRAVLLARSPNALLLADVSPERNRTAAATVKRIAEVGSGPSRVAVGRVGVDGEGKAAPCNDQDESTTCRSLAVVSCFSARQIYVIDLATMEALAVIPNLSGPFDLKLDEHRGLLYVTDFRSSVLRVLDLKPAVSGADDSVRVIARIGQPKIVQELR